MKRILYTLLFVTGLSSSVSADTIVPDGLEGFDRVVKPFFAKQLGTGALGLHQIGHGSGVGDMTSPQLRRKIVVYHMGLIAKMAKRFAGIREGDGTMLDNTLIVYTSCAGGQHHAGSTDWPFITLGGVGGKLKTGRYIQYPSYAHDGHKSIANLYMSIMTAADTPNGEHFGQVDPGLRDLDLSGPLGELLA